MSRTFNVYVGKDTEPTRTFTASHLPDVRTRLDQIKRDCPHDLIRVYEVSEDKKESHYNTLYPTPI